MTIVPASSIARQFWCEMQVDLRRKYGDVRTPEMKRGSEIHESLLLEISEVIPVRVETPADKLHVIVHNIIVGTEQYKRKGITRELPVLFKFDHVFILGFIDEIAKTGRGGIYLTQVVETKTRMTKRHPSPSQVYCDKMQGMIYWYGLSSMISRGISIEEVCSAFEIDPNRISISEEYAMSLGIPSAFLEGTFIMDIKTALKEIAKLPKLSNKIKLKYIYQGTGEEIYREEYEFNHKLFDQKMKWALDYWLGRRDAVPVRKNRWKCKFCSYKNICPAVR
ncbi:MAG: hypothetical protein DRN91_01865 [Candidatus Alkanophagales archaeon]|nr:MAG: hypothetical protein DRN91_01865 [Candidatus Alkanophagales archaeon]